MSIRVLVVDDENLVRSGLRLILETEGDLEVVGEAANGVEAVEAAAELDPDVILMDVQMPVKDGLAATREIVALGKAESCRVIILTTFELDEYVYEALRAGASGFLLKRVPARAWSRGSGSWPPERRCWRRRSHAVCSTTLRHARRRGARTPPSLGH
jgi:DNA-binding NarL/FixJ family response regulator